MTTLHCTCGRELALPEGSAGTAVPCPACGTLLSTADTVTAARPAAPRAWKTAAEEETPAGAPRGLVITLMVVAGVLAVVGMLLFGYFAYMQKEGERQASNNLKQMVLAMHNYNDTYGRLPPQASRSPEGKPLLSWRVAILPFIEQDHLYKQFKLDEPWDSPHNARLVEQMPRVYQDPERPDDRSLGRTHYQVFHGPGTPWADPDQPPGIPHSFPDGTSNTLLIVEAASTVLWTKPDDLTLGPAGELPALATGKRSRRGALAALADGSVRLLPPHLTPTTLRNAINPSDGNVLGSDW
jgi:hypothetical protein